MTGVWTQRVCLGDVEPESAVRVVHGAAQGWATRAPGALERALLGAGDAAAAPSPEAGQLKPLSLWAILVQEEAPPAGVTPIVWLLWTSLPITDLDAALRCVRWYSYRWLIERYHFVLKSGCRLEDLQLAAAARLERALATYCIVAWRLLWLTYEARQNPDTPCERALERSEWQALYCHIHKTSRPPATPPTLRQAVRWIAQLGGFLGRKWDGEPGVQTIWLGLRRLADMTAMWQLMMPPPHPGFIITYG